MALRLFCSPCGAEIYQPNAELMGPPDLSHRSRKHAICRTCFNRLLAYWPALKEKAAADRGGLNRGGPYGSGTALGPVPVPPRPRPPSPPSETPRSRQGHRGR